MKKIILVLQIITANLTGNCQDCSISNILVQQRTDGSSLVDIQFNLYGSANPHFIEVEVTTDEGETYNLLPLNCLIGDVWPVTPGVDKHIVWDAMTSHPELYLNNAKLRIKAIAAQNYTPCPGTHSVTDIDGNVYNTMLIGTKCWMRENLRTTRNAMGVSISRHCYDNIPSNCRIYGGLYNWETVMDSASSSSANPSGVLGICPAGWHVPSDAEWTQLVNYLVSTYGWSNLMFDEAGLACKLRSCRKVNSPVGCDCNTTEHPRWNYHSSYHGTNHVGFSALPGGGRSSGGLYSGVGSETIWWSATQRTSTLSWSWRIRWDQGEVNRSSLNKASGYSLRCVKN